MHPSNLPRRCGEATLSLLEQYGVDTVFGIPGVHTQALYRGFASTRIRHVLARNEQGAGFMADGYARASGRPGVALVITGPGVTNALTPLAQAYADSIPVLLVSSENATETLGKGHGELHELRDQRAMTLPVTGYSETAKRIEDVPLLLGRAMQSLTSGRPRPAHVALPIDVLDARVDANDEAAWVPLATPARPAPNATAITQAVARLAPARAPVICVGGGAVAAGVQLRAVAERLDAPVLASNLGKGILADSHPLALGATLPLAGSRALLAAADVILAVGTELAWTDSFEARLPITGAIIRIDIDPTRFADRYPSTVAIQADAALALAALDEALDVPLDADGTGRAQAARRGNATSLSPLQHKHKRVLDSVRSALAHDGMLAADATQIAYTAQHEFPVDLPRSWLYAPGYCTLGGALPCAIGAMLACPERKAIALAGDGGFMFTVQELSVAVQLRLPLPIIVWNNDGLGQIKAGMLEDGYEPVGVSPLNPDFMALARAFGARAERPANASDLKRAIGDAFEAEAPTVIEIREDDPWLA